MCDFSGEALTWKLFLMFTLSEFLPVQYKIEPVKQSEF